MNRPALNITQISNVDHTSQIVTGIHLLKNHGYRVAIPRRSRINKLRYPHMAIVEVEYRAKKIIYDVLDGYQYPEAIQYYLDNCDFYFKRSFSEDKNQALLQRYEGKLFPLGFNYHVSFWGNPTNENLLKSIAKVLIGKTPKAYYTPHVFEERPTYKESHFKILFITRLWDDHDPTLSPQLNQERSRINQMRIEIIRTMRKRFGDQFIGVLNNEPIAQKYAPDLIISADQTHRKNYLKLVHSCDICIGSMGLHESIGWKTGEYVAAGKAIVNETLRYSLPGNYTEGVHYISFQTQEECIEAVQKLLDSPQDIYAMKMNNYTYYNEYLRPDRLIQNTLQIIDESLDTKDPAP